MVQYWRAAGMTYLKYSAHCATLVRNAVKESVKQAAKKGKNAKAGEFSMMKAEWEGGKIVTRSTYLYPDYFVLYRLRIGCTHTRSSTFIYTAQVEKVPGATV